MLEILFIFAAIYIFLVILWYVCGYKYFIYLRKIPGPTPLPIIGNLLDVSTLDNLIPNITKFINQYGNIYKFTIFYGRTAIITQNLKLIEFVLSNPTLLKKSLTYDFVKSWLGNGLLTSTGSQWRTHRKIITPAFHFKILEQFVEVFDKNADIMIESLSKELQSKSFDIYSYLTLMALDNICETALGIEAHAQKDYDCQSEYVKCVHDMCNVVVERSLRPWYSINFLYRFSHLYKREKYNLSVLHGTTRTVIRKRKELAKNKMENTNERTDSVFEGKQKLAFLDLLLKSATDGKTLTDEELREEVDTFMFAGHDTTTTALSFIFYLLSLNPDVQNRVLDELRVIFDDDFTKACTYADLQKMKYLEAVIKETLRLYPPVPLIGRQTETAFDFDGLTIPSGIHIILFLYGLLRDPQYYPEPEKFDPSRFLQGKRFDHPFSYIPFSAGPRNCLGQKFAMLEIKTTVAKVLKTYEILSAEPHHKLDISPEITLKSKNGIRIRIRKRQL